MIINHFRYVYLPPILLLYFSHAILTLHLSLHYLSLMDSLSLSWHGIGSSHASKQTISKASWSCSLAASSTLIVGNTISNNIHALNGEWVMNEWMWEAKLFPFMTRMWMAIIKLIIPACFASFANLFSLVIESVVCWAILTCESNLFNANRWVPNGHEWHW